MITVGRLGSLAIYELVRDDYVCERRGTIEVRRMGAAETCFLRAAADVDQEYVHDLDPQVLVPISFRRSTQVSASPATVWATLHDVDLLASYSSHLGPVTTVERGRRWSVPLQDRVGPFRLSAPMDVELVEETVPELVSMRASGRDRGPGTRLVVEASVRIEETNGDTLLVLKGTYEMSGRVATLGAGLARRQADVMIDEFWTNLTAGLQA